MPVPSDLSDRLRDRVADMLAENDSAGPGPVSRSEYLDDARAILDLVVTDAGFTDLVSLTRRILDTTYPADVFGSGPFSLDAGARFTTKLREALAMVHADA